MGSAKDAVKGTESVQYPTKPLARSVSRAMGDEMTTAKQLAEMVGIDEGNMKMFLDLYAIEVKAGSTLEDAIQNVHTMFTRMASEAERPASQQADWFKAWKQTMSVEVWHTVRRRDELRRILA